MTARDTTRPPSSHEPPASRRKWTGYVLLGLLIVLLSGVAGFGALVEIGGYCGSDYLPFEDRISAAPYVQNVGSKSATIMWRTNDDTDGHVTFGVDGEMDRTADSDTGKVHEVRLTDLMPNAQYTYQVHTGDRRYDASTFRTAPGPDGEVTAIVVGDTGSGSEAQFEMAEMLTAMDADLVLHTGDVVYRRGAGCHYEERYYDPYDELIDSVPVYPVLGNHDILTDNGEPYLTAFALPTESSGTERYYSFDYGPMHIAAIDSELYYEDDSVSAEQQKAWLRDDLAASDRPWKVIVIHRPPYSSSPYHGGDQQILDDLVSIFEKEGVDVVFAGHEHVYERLVPISGITYFVTGGGGGDLRSAGQSELTATSELRHHALKVEVGPKRMQIDAVGIDGEVFDSIELTEPAG